MVIEGTFSGDKQGEKVKISRTDGNNLVTINAEKAETDGIKSVEVKVNFSDLYAFLNRIK